VSTVTLPPLLADAARSSPVAACTDRPAVRIGPSVRTRPLYESHPLGSAQGLHDRH